MSEKGAASQVAAAVAILALFAAVAEGWLGDIVAQVRTLTGRSSHGSNQRTPGPPIIPPGTSTDPGAWTLPPNSGWGKKSAL